MNNATTEKVPSEYATKDGQVLWGNLIPPNLPRHKWTKLQLDAPPKGEAAKIHKEVFAIQESDKQPVDIVAAFLAQVRIWLVKNLDKRYGEETWRTLPVTLVVTVPAVWSDRAKFLTLEAVAKAGFNELGSSQSTTVILVTEPEAAALYTIRNMRGTTHDLQFKTGEGFILCDMGGGTIDLISYRIAATRPTRIEEATVGGGAQCGGSFVDRAFIRWLGQLLGEKTFEEFAGCKSEDISRVSQSMKLAQLLHDFNYEAKGGFNGIHPRFLRLPKPLDDIQDESKGISDGYLKISA